jgi:hypothetical protein
LIKPGTEHPQFEFKRTCSISHDNLDDRLEFIKLLQGIANTEVAGERCIIVGADPEEKSFYAVDNAAQFDPATNGSIIGPLAMNGKGDSKISRIDT